MEAVAHEVLVEAPAEAVWAWVATAEGMARWHSDHPLAIQLEARFGGRLRVSGEFHGLVLAREGEVLEAEAPHRFAYRSWSNLDGLPEAEARAAWCALPWSQWGMDLAAFRCARKAPTAPRTGRT